MLLTFLQMFHIWYLLMKQHLLYSDVRARNAGDCTKHRKIPEELCKLKYKHCQGDPCMLFWLLAVGRKTLVLHAKSKVAAQLWSQLSLEVKRSVQLAGRTLFNSTVQEQWCFIQIPFVYICKPTKIFIHKMLMSQSRNSRLFPVQIL